MKVVQLVTSRGNGRVSVDTNKEELVTVFACSRQGFGYNLHEDSNGMVMLVCCAGAGKPKIIPIGDNGAYMVCVNKAPITRRKKNRNFRSIRQAA